MSDLALTRTLVVRARGVTLRAAALPLRRGLDLDVGAGSIHALLGGNGAGKSTLVSALLGAVAFGGTIERADPVGLVPQRFTPDPTIALTVGEFLALTRQRGPIVLGTGACRARVAAALALFELSALRDRPLAELSGGELRRVLLGNAFEPAPPLLLLDEPTEGLDSAARARLEELLCTARQRGAGILLVTHDRALAARLADQVTDLDRPCAPNEARA